MRGIGVEATFDQTRRPGEVGQDRRAEASGGRIEANVYVSEAEPRAEERKPRLVDAFFGAEEKDTPWQVRIGGPDPRAFLVVGDALEDTVRQRPAPFRVDAEGGNFAGQGQGGGAISGCMSDAAADAGGPERLAGRSGEDGHRGKAELLHRASRTFAAAGEIAASLLAHVSQDCFLFREKIARVVAGDLRDSGGAGEE